MDENGEYVFENPGVQFREVQSGTYLAYFSDFSRDKAIHTAQAQYYLQQVRRAAADHAGQKINIINDTRKISDRVRYLSSSARQAYLEAYSLPEIGRVAMVGFGPWLKGFILLLARVANRTSQTSFFDTPEEALVWVGRERIF